MFTAWHRCAGEQGRTARWSGIRAPNWNRILQKGRSTAALAVRAVWTARLWELKLHFEESLDAFIGLLADAEGASRLEPDDDKACQSHYIWHTGHLEYSQKGLRCVNCAMVGWNWFATVVQKIDNNWLLANLANLFARHRSALFQAWRCSMRSTRGCERNAVGMHAGPAYGPAKRDCFPFIAVRCAWLQIHISASYNKKLCNLQEYVIVDASPRGNMPCILRCCYNDCLQWSFALPCMLGF